MLASYKTNLGRQQETISGAISGYVFTAAGTTYDFEENAKRGQVSLLELVTSCT